MDVSLSITRAVFRRPQCEVSTIRDFRSYPCRQGLPANFWPGAWVPGQGEPENAELPERFACTKMPLARWPLGVQKGSKPPGKGKGGARRAKVACHGRVNHCAGMVNWVHAQMRVICAQNASESSYKRSKLFFHAMIYFFVGFGHVSGRSPCAVAAVLLRSLRCRASRKAGLEFPNAEWPPSPRQSDLLIRAAACTLVGLFSDDVAPRRSQHYMKCFVSKGAK